MYLTGYIFYRSLPVTCKIGANVFNFCKMYYRSFFKKIMETTLTIILFIIFILIGIGAYHNYYVLNTFNYERKKHETYLNKVTSLLWKVIFIFICLWLLYILRN